MWFRESLAFASLAALSAFPLHGAAEAPRAKSVEYVPAFPLKAKTLASFDPATSEGMLALLDKFSSPLLGKPYANGPLGEGEGKDPDPLYRLDAFDCTTFIETIMANAVCARAGEKMAACLEKTMARIRYAGGKVGFDTRNHVPETDWLPNNVKEGFLEEMTTMLFPGETKKAKVTIDRAHWLRSQRPDPQGAPAMPASSIREVPYLPVSYFFEPAKLAPADLEALEKTQGEWADSIEKKIAEAKSLATKEEALLEKFRGEMDYLKKIFLPLEDRLKKIPAGSVLNLVRGNIPDPAKAKLMPVITHQGLVFQKDDGAYFRHAAPNIGHASEQRLSDYLIRYVKSPKARGITVFRVRPTPQGK